MWILQLSKLSILLIGIVVVVVVVVIANLYKFYSKNYVAQKINVFTQDISQLYPSTLLSYLSRLR